MLPTPLERTAQELRYAARGLLRQRGFLASATLILGLGIGICTAMFSIVHAVLLRPLAIRNADRIAMLWSLDTRDQTRGELSYSARRDLVEALPSFEDVALVGSVNWSGTLRLPRASPVSLATSPVSGTFFDVLGASAMLGRTLTARDDEAGAAAVIVLSHAAWTQYFGADPAIVGRKVPMGAAASPELVEVVGVMPPDFFFPRGAQYWTAALPELSKFAAESGDSLQTYLDILGVFYGVGRLRPDANLDAVRDEGRRFIDAQGRKHGVDLSGQRLQLTPLLDHVFGGARYALVLLMAAVVMVLLIACGNVAGLIFARGASQAREMAVRAALGASRSAVTVVSAATAARLWPGQDPIGRRLRLSASEDRWHTVVGVVGTARYRELAAPRFDVYVPLRQSDPDGPYFVVRTAVDPLTIVPAVAAQIAEVDKSLALSRIATMDAIVRRAQGPWRFNMLVFGLFGGVALGLAAVGLFALVACDVAQRRREIGLRMALGARPGAVVRLMIWEGAKPSALGVAAGLLIAFAVTRTLARFLFDVTPTDPLTFASVVLVFAVVIVIASYLPARRAAAIDPQVVLRE